ncbi:hypothetical protein GCM10009772_14610 [Pseudonocardia alni subsp. carboxydivorans]
MAARPRAPITGDSLAGKRAGGAAMGRTPWFGPKRVGWGLRPQTWQGRVLTAALAAALLVVAAVVH